MADQKQRIKPAQGSKQSQNLGSRQDVHIKEQNKTQQQKWVVEKAIIYESPIEELIPKVQAEVDLIQEDETLERDADTDNYFDMSKPVQDDDLYDYYEYGEDNPAADPDDLVFKDSVDNNSFDILKNSTAMDPIPDIVIDEFGCVEIGREEKLLEKYYSRFQVKKITNSQTVLHILSNAKDLRAIGESLVEKAGKFILEKNSSFHSADNISLVQKEFMKPLGITDPALSSKILRDCYVKTPYWGTLPLSHFFQGAAKKWDKPIKYLKTLIKNEDFKNPYKTEELWEKLNKKYRLGHENSRMMKENMNDKGIPLTNSRKNLFNCLEKWISSNKPVTNVESKDIDTIHSSLLEKFDLFKNSHSQKCKQEHYNQFVKERIIDILKDQGLYNSLK